MHNQLLVSQIQRTSKTRKGKEITKLITKLIKMYFCTQNFETYVVFFLILHSLKSFRQIKKSKANVNLSVWSYNVTSLEQRSNDSDYLNKPSEFK